MTEPKAMNLAIKLTATYSGENNFDVMKLLDLLLEFLRADVKLLFQKGFQNETNLKNQQINRLQVLKEAFELDYQTSYLDNLLNEFNEVIDSWHLSLSFLGKLTPEEAINRFNLTYDVVKYHLQNKVFELTGDTFDKSPSSVLLNCNAWYSLYVDLNSLGLYLPDPAVFKDFDNLVGVLEDPRDTHPDTLLEFLIDKKYFSHIRVKDAHLNVQSIDFAKGLTSFKKYLVFKIKEMNVKLLGFGVAPIVTKAFN